MHMEASHATGSIIEKEILPLMSKELKKISLNEV